MKKAAIFLYGNKPSKKNLSTFLSSDMYVICADGGAEYVIQENVKPEIVIGDMDSLSTSIQNELRKTDITWIPFPAEKDETDSELALEYAIKNGYTDITIFGMYGDRVDHFLSNIFLFEEASKMCNIKIVTDGQVMYLVRNQLRLSGNRGEFVSLVPISGDVHGITTTGLKYPLHKETLYLGKTRGVSNEFMEKTVEIGVEEGCLLVAHSYLD